MAKNGQKDIKKISVNITYYVSYLSTFIKLC